jgi:hypothetical protein
MPRVLVIVIACVMALGACGSSDDDELVGVSEGSGLVSSAEEVSERLTVMMQDTIDAVGLEGAETIEEREFTACSAPLKPGEEADSWGINYPTVDEVEGRAVMRRMVEFWEREAPGWAREGFEVRADDAAEKSTPAVYLEIDGFSISASYWVGAGSEAFRFGGSAPCVKRL